MTPKISIVIVSYNVCDFVISGIASLYKFTTLPLEIIVVDNNSSDNTITEIKSNFKDVIVISNQVNVGFSAANNQGFEICTGDYIVLFNPDAELIENSFDVIITEIKKHELRDVLLGTTLINTNNTYQTSCWKFPSPLQHFLELCFINKWIDITQYKSSTLNNSCEVDFLSGAFIFAKQSTLKKLHGLDVDLFWMDDVDICKRNIEQGGINIYLPSTKVKHHMGKSSNKNQKVVISNQIISKLKFYKKQNQLFYFYSSIPIFLFHIISRIPLFFTLSIFNKSFKDKTNAYFYTFSKLFNYLFFGNKKVI